MNVIFDIMRLNTITRTEPLTLFTRTKCESIKTMSLFFQYKFIIQNPIHKS